MKLLISTSAALTNAQKIAALKQRKNELVAKCKEQLAKIDEKLEALGHKPDMKLAYGRNANTKKHPPRQTMRRNTGAKITVKKIKK